MQVLFYNYHKSVVKLIQTVLFVNFPKDDTPHNIIPALIRNQAERLLYAKDIHIVFLPNGY